MRVLVSAYTDHPIAWKISKCEDANPKGIKTITLYQDFFNQHRDYIEKDETGKIIGMWADYYDNNNPNIQSPNDLIDDCNTSITNKNYAKIKATTPSIKIGGTYRVLTINIFDSQGTNITDNYKNASFKWTCFIDDENFTDKVSWSSTQKFNQQRIKFINDRKYLGKVLKVKCTIINNIDLIETIEEFDLII